MKKLFSAITLLWIAALSHEASAQQIVLVNSSNGGACIPTPSGVISSKYCEDGDDGSAAIPLLWSTVPSFTNKVEGTPFLVDVCAGYLTQLGSPNATITNVGASFPTGWSLSGTDNCTLDYSGTGTGSATIVLRATRLAATSDTNQFTISSIASASADTTAPTIITGVQVVLNDSDRPVITFDAAADVRVSGQNVSDVATFTVYRGATALTPTAYTGTTFVPTFADTDVGTVVGSSATQSGANWTLVGEGGHPNTGTDHVFANAGVTGDFTATVKITSISGGSDVARAAGLSVRAGTSAGARQFALARFASGSVRSYTRTTTDGAVTQAGVVADMSPPFWLRITRVGDVFTGYASADGNEFSEVRSETISLGSAVNVGPTATSNQAGTPITVAADNLTVTTRARQTYTDSSGTPGSSSYTVRSTDGAANVAAASVAFLAPAVPIGSTTDTPDYDDLLEGVTLLGGRTTTPCASSAACITELADQDCNETLSIANGVTVTGNQSITADCNTNNPFIVKCANERLCTLSGLWTFTEASANNILRDVLFSGTGAKVFCDGDTNHIINSEFTGWSGIAISPRNNDGRGRRCEVGYVRCYNPAPFAAPDDSTQFRMCLRTNDDNVTDFHVGGWYHHIHCENFPAKPNPVIYATGQSDCGEIGESDGGSYPQVNAQTWVEYWLLTNHYQGGQNSGVCGGTIGGVGVVGAASMDFKVGGVVARYITFDHVCGNIDARGGSLHGRTFESFYFDTDSPAGVGVRGDNVRVIGNRIVGPLNITAGQMACTAPTADPDANGANNYPASCNALVVGNVVSGTTNIGHRYSGGDSSWTFPASNVTLRAHTGAISQRGNDCPPPSGACVTGANIDATAAAGVNFVPPVMLLPADVGPLGFNSAAAGYTGPRGGL